MNRLTRTTEALVLAAILVSAPAVAHGSPGELRMRTGGGSLAASGLSMRDDPPLFEVAGSPDDLLLGGGVSSAEGRKSPIVAAFLSCVLPGWGELYAGESGRGKCFMAAEAAIWLAYAGFTVQGNMRTDDYQEYAGTFAGAPTGMSDQYYDDISDYVRGEGADSYNEAVRAEARGIYPNDIGAQHDYLDENGYSGDELWEWESYDRFLEYRDLRYGAKMSFRKAFYMTGLAVLNRAVSAIDSAWIVRSKNLERSGGPRLSVLPDFSDGTYGSTLRLEIPF